MTRFRIMTAAVATLFVAACGNPAPADTAETCDGVRSGGDDAGAMPAPSLFVPYATDFCGYHSWKHFDISDGATFSGLAAGATVGDQSAKAGETAIAYVNRLPPPGSTTFPVGTIIVKQILGGATPQTHAMVKRGGATYNPTVPGWEWLELQDLPNGGVHINWFGVGPPSTGSDLYGGDPTQGCNGCHKQCLANDAACSKAFQLSNF